MSNKQKQKTRLAESPWVIPGTLAVIALLFRGLFYSQFRLTPFFDHLYSDSRLFADIANSIVSGDTSVSAVFMSQFYPVFLAFIADRLGDIQVWARLFQVALGTGTVLLVYYTGKRLFNSTAGYFAGLLAALYPAFIFYDSQILLESLLTFVLIFHLYAFLRSASKETLLWPSLAGLAMGLSIALRGSLILIVPVLGVYLWMVKDWTGSKLKFAGLYIAFALIVLVPFGIRNSNLAGEFVPLTNSFGLNLYAGNNESTDGRYFVPEKFDGYRDPMGSTVAESEAGKPLTSAEVNDFWQGKAWDWIAGNPGDFIALYAKKLLLFFQYSKIHQTGLSRAFITKEYGTVLDLPLPPFALVFGLMLAGLVFAWRWNAPRILAIVYMVSYVAATALFFVNDRLRTPVVVIMVLFAGFALSEALQAVQRRSFAKAGTAFGFAAILAVAIGLLQPSILQTFDSEYNRLGDTAFIEGKFSSAEQYFAKSVKENPTAINITNLGNALAAQRKFPEAERMYEDAIRLNKNYAPAFFNKGNMAHQRGKLDVAFRYWSKTLELDPEYAPAYRNIGLLLMQAGRFREAKGTLLRYIEVEPDAEKQNEIRRDITNIDDMLRRTPEDR